MKKSTAIKKTKLLTFVIKASHNCGFFIWVQLNGCIKCTSERTTWTRVTFAYKWRNFYRQIWFDFIYKIAFFNNCTFKKRFFIDSALAFNEKNILKRTICVLAQQLQSFIGVEVLELELSK